MGSSKLILVFSDPHGRIPLLLWLVWRWQREHDRQVDLILVAGDLGVWPDSQHLDNSTRKYSQSDPTELGFQVLEPLVAIPENTQSEQIGAHLSRARDLLDRILPDIRAKIGFVGGNHEDYNYLRACAEMADKNHSPYVSVEQSGCVVWLRPGLAYGECGIHVTGISGIDPASCGRDPSKYHPASVITEDSIIDSTLRLLEALETRGIDILLTHDGLPDAAKPGKGTLKLLQVIEALNPRYHFFGHYHSSIDPIVYADWLPELARWYPQVREICPKPSNIRTTGIHINKLAFDHGTGSLRRHVMGVLEIDSFQELSFHFVEEEWLSKIDARST